jgi:4-amino-4-deoxy-L-arabinose transferase-like glycosyltransferase
MSFTNFVLRIVGAMLFTVIIYAAIAPVLFNSASDIAVLLGILLCTVGVILGVYWLIKPIIKEIVNLFNNNNQNLAT